MVETYRRFGETKGAVGERDCVLVYVRSGRRGGVAQHSNIYNIFFLEKIGH